MFPSNLSSLPLSVIPSSSAREALLKAGPDADGEFLYRVDGSNQIQAFTEPSFRFPAWSGRYDRLSFDPVLAELPTNHWIFRLGYFVEWDGLLNEASREHANRDHVAITRIRRAMLMEAGVSMCRDHTMDGYGFGSMLFYVIEDRSDPRKRWSDFQIPFSAIERLNLEGQWVALEPPK